jgi:hypothetical protein
MTTKRDKISSQKVREDQAIKDKYRKQKDTENRAVEKSENEKNRIAKKSIKDSEVDPNKFEKDKSKSHSSDNSLKSSGRSQKSISAFCRTVNFNNKTNSNWNSRNQLKESLSHSIIRSVKHSLTEIGKTKEHWNKEDLQRNLIFTNGKIINMSELSGEERKKITENIITQIDNEITEHSKNNNIGQVSEAANQHRKISNNRTSYKNKIFKNLPELKQFFEEQKLETKSTKKIPDPKAKFHIQIPVKTEQKIICKVNSIIDKSNLTLEQKKQYKINAEKFFQYRREAIDNKKNTSRLKELNTLGNIQNFTQIQEMVFRIPNRNGVKLSGVEQLQTVIDYYEKHFKDYEITAAVLHGDEANEKQKAEYKNNLPSIENGLEGDHVHIFVKGKNKNTNQYDLRETQKKLYSEHLKKINSRKVLPMNKKNLNIREQQLLGLAIQDHFYKHINENLLNKNGLNAEFTHSKLKIKIEANLPKEIRKMNLDNFNYEVKSKAEIAEKTRELLLLTIQKVVADIGDIPIKERLTMDSIKKNIIEDLINNKTLLNQVKKEVMISKIGNDIENFKEDKKLFVDSEIKQKTEELNQEINNLKQSQKDEIFLIRSHQKQLLKNSIPVKKYNNLVITFNSQNKEITRLKNIENKYHSLVENIKVQSQKFGKFIINVFKNENGKQNIIDYKNENNQHEIIREILKDGFNYEYDIVRNGINYNNEILEIGDQKDLINIENDTISKMADKEVLNYLEVQKAKSVKKNLIKKDNKSNNTRNKPIYKNI